MRMWMVEPTILCRQHLLGEHLELHMFTGVINKGNNLHGYINNNLCDPSSIIRRHDALVEEMQKRGYSHRSPLQLKKEPVCTPINMEAAKKALLARCPECNRRQGDLNNGY